MINKILCQGWQPKPNYACHPSNFQVASSRLERLPENYTNPAISKNARYAAAFFCKLSGYAREVEGSRVRVRC